MGVFGASFVTATASLRVATQQNSLGPIKYHGRVFNQLISQSCSDASLKICASFSLLLVPIEDIQLPLIRAATARQLGALSASPAAASASASLATRSARRRLTSVS